MNIKEIELLYSNKLVKNDLFINSVDEKTRTIKKVGVPDIILNKFEPYDKMIANGIITFSKSRLSKIYLGIEKESGNVVCFSDTFNTNSFVNVNYETFIIANYTYETFKNICMIPQTYGAYYDNTPSGGNFEKYANVLKELLSEIDQRAVKEGVWHSLIEEMSLGVI